MRFKLFPKCNVQVSTIGFGAMRWPSEEECFRIMNHGLDLGLNYVDCSTGYVSGQSQRWVGRAVAKRRKEILFSSKSSFSKAPTADQAREAIDKSLQDAGLDYFDFYQLWGLSTAETLQSALSKGGFIEGVRRAQRDGLIRLGLGFTFHGSEELFRATVDTGEFVCATVSYNLMNRKEEANIQYAGEHGLGVIIMNPLAGGILGLARDRALDFLRGDGLGPCYGALRFLHANPAICTDLVGFRAVSEVDEAVATLKDCETLSASWREEQMKRMDAVKLIEGQFCTGCEYCKDCPHQFNPPRFMQVMRDFVRYGMEPARLKDWIYSRYVHQDALAHFKLCKECGACEKQCPQHLAIVEQIRRAKAAIGV